MSAKLLCGCWSEGIHDTISHRTGCAGCRVQFNSCAGCQMAASGLPSRSSCKHQGAPPPLPSVECCPWGHESTVSLSAAACAHFRARSCQRPAWSATVDAWCTLGRKCSSRLQPANACARRGAHIRACTYTTSRCTHQLCRGRVPLYRTVLDASCDPIQCDPTSCDPIQWSIQCGCQELHFPAPRASTGTHACPDRFATR